MIQTKIDRGGLKAATETYRFELSPGGARGVLFDARTGRGVLDISLLPHVNGEPLAGFAVTSITGAGDSAEAAFSCPAGAGRISLRFSEGGISYRYTLPDVGPITRVGPGPAGGELFQIHNFDPDLEKLDIPHRITTALKFNSRLTASKEFLHFDCGNYMIPPYLIGIFDRQAFIGFGLLDVPDVDMPIDAQVSVAQFQQWLDYSARPRGGPYESPRFALLLAPTRAGLLDAYRQAVELEHPRRGAPPGAWCYDPIYTTWGDQVYAKHLAEGRFPKEAGSEKYLTAELVDLALARLAENAIRPGTIVLDEGWSRALGDWRADDARFGGSLAAFIRAKQTAGHHVVLYFNPFLVDPAAPLVAEHPQWLRTDAAGQRRSVERGGRGYHLLDWSHPLARSAMLKAVARLVDPAGLGADGVKLAGMKYLPAPADRLTDASYGAGERYLQAVLRDIHAAVKTADPRAPIYLACLNPLLADTFDVVRAGNTSEVNQEEHVKRAGMASRLMPDKPVDTDDWASYAKVLGITTFVKAALGVPNLFSAFYRGDGRPAYGGAAGGCPMRMDPRQYRILAAAWKAYEFSRSIPRGRLNVDFDRAEFGMADAPTGGPFVRTYQGGSTLAVYDGRELYLASVQGGAIVLDLPTGFRPASMERLDHDGSRRPVEFAVVLGNRLMFDAAPAKDGAMIYRVKG